ncbi:DUF6153 family protein [Nocardia sp. NPDC055053]
MIDQHPLERAPGIARVLAMLMLLAGIVAMHSAVFGTAHATAAETSHAVQASHVSAVAQQQTHDPHPSPAGAAEATRAGAYPPAHAGAVEETPASTSQSAHAGAVETPHIGTAEAPRTGTTDATQANSATQGASDFQPIDRTDAATDIAQGTAPADDKHATGSGCGAAGCGEHAAVHSCVFVLAALAVALTLVLLYRLTGDTAATGNAATRPWRGRRERPPPWTVLSLSQLAILRI